MKPVKQLSGDDVEYFQQLISQGYSMSLTLSNVSELSLVEFLRTVFEFRKSTIVVCLVASPIKRKIKAFSRRSRALTTKK